MHACGAHSPSPAVRSPLFRNNAHVGYAHAASEQRFRIALLYFNDDKWHKHNSKGINNGPQDVYYVTCHRQCSMTRGTTADPGKPGKGP